MNKNLKGLICMSFDGEYITEKRAEFETIQDAWDHANDMGSRWYFYPFSLVVNNSGQTVIDAPEGLEFLKGKRVKRVSAFFKKVSELPDNQGVDCESFSLSLMINEELI